MIIARDYVCTMQSHPKLWIFFKGTWKILHLFWYHTGPPWLARLPRPRPCLDFKEKKAAAHRWCGCHYGGLACQQMAVAAPATYLNRSWIIIFCKIQVDCENQILKSLNLNIVKQSLCHLRASLPLFWPQWNQILYEDRSQLFFSVQFQDAKACNRWKILKISREFTDFFQIFLTDRIAISTSELFRPNFGFSLPSLGHALSAPRAQNAHLPRVPNQMVPSVYKMGWNCFWRSMPIIMHCNP